MKSIHYAGYTLRTGDAIADALVHYAEALARRETSAAVDVPVRTDDGELDRVSVLLGPASQLVAAPEHGVGEDIVDERLVASLYLEAARLGDPKPQTDDDPEPDGHPGMLDDLGRD